MSRELPILRSLDPHQQRIGYVNAVVMVAQRGLDTRDALLARLDELIFRRIYCDDPLWTTWYERADPAERSDLETCARVAIEDDPASILLRKNTRAVGWVFAQRLWIADARMPSHLGLLKREEDKIGRPVELSKWLNVILPTYELSEEGVVLRSLLETEREMGETFFNPLLVHGRVQIQLMYLQLLLRAEVLIPHLIVELVAAHDEGQLRTRGEQGLLRRSVESLLTSIGEPRYPGDILAAQRIHEFRDSVLKSLSTEENYLRPRMEILVDLGLIDRKVGRENFSWCVTERTVRMAAALKPLAEGKESLMEFLDFHFIKTLIDVFGLMDTQPLVGDERLRAFADAFPKVGRELGFTPARTVATLACLNKLGEGLVIEIGDLLEAVRAASKSQFSEFIHFSGGSRFDQEFLVRVDRKILAALSASV